MQQKEQMVQSIIIDLDNTLLRSDLEISADDIGELARLRKAGILVLIATARHFCFALKYVKALDMRLPMVCQNGAVICDPSSGQTLRSVNIGGSAAAGIIDFCIGHGLHFLVNNASGLLLSTGNPRLSFIDAYNRVSQPEDRLFPVTFERNGFDFLGITKISVCNPEGGDVHREMAGLLNGGDLAAEYSAASLLDIFPASASKGGGLKFLAEYLGFDPLNCIAFGDNHNDISMLKAAGHPVAVGNAVDELKAVAEYVTLDNDHSGVSFALRHRYRDLLPRSAVC